MLLIAFILLLPLALAAPEQDGSISIATSKSGSSGNTGSFSGTLQTGTDPSLFGASQGLGLWALDTNNNRNVYHSAKTGSSISLLRYSSGGGPAKLYDIREAGAGLAGTVTTISLAAGFSQGIYQIVTAGRHMLVLSAGNAASNVLIVDVGGQAGAGTATVSLGSLTTPISGSTLQVIDHSIASQVDEENAEVITKANTFTTSSSKVYSWIELGRIDAAHEVEWRWFSPDGSLYDSFDEKIPKPDGEPWEFYDVYAYIPIAGEEAAQMPGNWRVDIYLDGQKAITEQFTIIGKSGHQPSGTATGSMQSGCRTDPVTGQIICVDTFGDFSNPGEVAQGGCYTDPVTGQIICVDAFGDISNEGGSGELI